jgi:RNA polymerase sigma factor (sigma-70 family)
MQFSAEYLAGRYDRSRGRLRSWIIGIARNRIIDMGRSRQKHAARPLDEASEGRAPSTDAEGDWEESVRKVILERALNTLRNDTRLDERTIRAFDMCALRNVPPEAAASECGMSVAEVYVAKNRAIKKLREIVDTLTREFDEA